MSRSYSAVTPAFRRVCRRGHNGRYRKRSDGVCVDLKKTISVPYRARRGTRAPPKASEPLDPAVRAGNRVQWHVCGDDHDRSAHGSLLARRERPASSKSAYNFADDGLGVLDAGDHGNRSFP